MEQDTTQSGWITTLEAYYAQHGPYILCYLNRLVGPKYPEDVLQDTFVQALLHIDKLRGLNSPRGRLFRIAHNPAKNVLRKKKYGYGYRVGRADAFKSCEWLPYLA